MVLFFLLNLSFLVSYKIVEPGINYTCNRLSKTEFTDYNVKPSTSNNLTCSFGTFGSNCQFNCSSILGHEFLHCEGHKICFNSKCEFLWSANENFYNNRNESRFEILLSSKDSEIILIRPLMNITKNQSIIKINRSNQNKLIINGTIKENYINYTIPVEFNQEYTIDIPGNQFREVNITILTPFYKFSSNPFVQWCSEKCFLMIPASEKQNNTETKFLVIKKDQVSTKQLLNTYISIINGEKEKGWIVNTIKNTTESFQLKIGENEFEAVSVYNNTYSTYLTFKNNGEFKFHPITFEEIKMSIIYVILFTLTAITVLVILIVSITYFVKNKYYLMSSLINTDIEMRLLQNDVNKEKEITIITRENFKSYFDQNIIKNLEQEFRAFQPVIIKESWEALRDINLNKNKDMRDNLPYDCNRVVLKKMEGLGFEDYINASYISGYDRPEAYIAGQGPKFNTVNDFWRMIWQENIEIVVMATNFYENEKRMCAEYWPQEERALLECGLMNITLIKDNFFEYLDVRTFKVRYCNLERTVRHFHLKWDSDIKQCLYPNNFILVLKEIRSMYEKSLHPILIHSSFGTNRTGTLILCDLALHMLKCENKINLNLLAQGLRKQRSNILSSVQYYILAHLIIWEYLIEEHNPFETSIDDYKNNLKDDNYIRYNEQELDLQLKYVAQLCDNDNIIQSWTTSDCQSTTDNITSTYVDGYGQRRKYVVTQQPKNNTLFGEFWISLAYRLKDVNNSNKESIVCIFLDKLKQGIWPMNTEYDNFVIRVRCLKSTNTPSYTLRELDLLIYHKRTKKILYEKHISSFELKNQKQPHFKNDILQLICDIKKNNNQCQIVVSCNNAVSLSGIFVIMSYIMDKYDNELEIDVCNAIRTTRRSGTNFITSLEQLKLVYICISEYLKNFENYNFIEK